jgi:DNA modification methylase
MKPIALVERSLQNSSKPGNLVFEPFSGSGTTLIASARTNRHARACELDPRYVSCALERWNELTGGMPVRVKA